MTFLSKTLDWLKGAQSSHMGPDQYVAHAGMCHGQSMSGPVLWAESEGETIFASGNMVNEEARLLRAASDDIVRELPHGIAVVELGPGTEAAFRCKTLPILQRLGSKTCYLIDESMEFLNNIASSGFDDALDVKPIVDNFFETENPYCDEDVLVCSFGSTISNFEGPISEKPPEHILVNGLTSMANAAHNGWLLVGFDSDQNGEHLKAFYKTQALFQLNIFYRIAAEFAKDIVGDFDPGAFAYEPEWIAASGQLAHIAVAQRAMNFFLKGAKIVLKKGQKLHIKNSYKFAPAFFERCCRLAGLEVIKAWSNGSPAQVYLLKILPRPIAVPQKLRRYS